MADIPLGNATFPGIRAVLQASYSLTHGISPGVATLEIAPQPFPFQRQGDLEFTYGRTRLVLKDCIVDTGGFHRNDQGEIWRVSILDRRWRWRFGTIWGRYNLREDDGTFVGAGTEYDSERTPKELAELCFEAMGETDYNLAPIYNETRPEVEWDFDNPAEALAELCDRIGCRVVLDWDGRVSICRTGYGFQLPIDNTVLENNAIDDPPEPPTQLAVATGTARYQADFLLEAVGKDTDGSIKPIDELSYAPSDGWAGKMPWPYFACVTVSKEARQLAVQTVYKWYRIVEETTVNPIPGWEWSKQWTRDDILPIEDQQVETRTINGREKSKPATVYGTWYPDDEGLANSVQTTAIDAADITQSEYQGNFTIDRENGIVQFQDYTYQNTETGESPTKLTVGEAYLFLRVAFGLREPGTRSPMRVVRYRGSGLPHLVKRDEIIPTLVPTYDANWKVTKITTNEQEVYKECDYYLDELQREYYPNMPQTVRYAGLRKIQPDGAIQQVTVSVGGGGTTTMASRNSEAGEVEVTYKERREIEKRKAAEEAAKRNTPEARKRQRRREGA